MDSSHQNTPAYLNHVYDSQSELLEDTRKVEGIPPPVAIMDWQPTKFSRRRCCWRMARP
jgi:hypothetical protein